MTAPDFTLMALDAPLEPVIIRTPLPVWARVVPRRWRKPRWERRVAVVRPMDAAGYELYQQSTETPDDAALTRTLIRRLMPDLTMAEYRMMTPAQLGFVLLHAMGALDSVIAYLGKVGAEPEVAAGPTPPETPVPAIP